MFTSEIGAKTTAIPIAQATASPANASLLYKPHTKQHAYKKNNRFYYTVGAYRILLEKKIKVENLSNVKVNNIPHTPQWCNGLVNVRGIIVPIVDLHVFLQTGKTSDQKKSRLILVEHESHSPIIFQIDELPKMISLDDFTYGKPPDKAPAWLKKSMKNGDNIIYEIDHSELLNLLKNTKN